MNCRPDQLAWIVVPREFQGSGVESLDGHVVRTLHLVAACEPPTWHVSPTLPVTIKNPSRAPSGELFMPGDRCICDALPDAWLRPFNPQSAPCLLPARAMLKLPVLEQTL